MKRTREFIRDHVVPVDDEFDGDIDAAGGEEIRNRMQAAACQAGLLTASERP